MNALMLRQIKDQIDADAPMAWPLRGFLAVIGSVTGSEFERFAAACDYARSAIPGCAVESGIAERGFVGAVILSGRRIPGHVASSAARAAMSAVFSALIDAAERKEPPPMSTPDPIGSTAGRAETLQAARRCEQEIAAQDRAEELRAAQDREAAYLANVTRAMGAEEIARLRAETVDPRVLAEQDGEARTGPPPCPECERMKTMSERQARTFVEHIEQASDQWLGTLAAAVAAEREACAVVAREAVGPHGHDNGPEFRTALAIAAAIRARGDAP